MADPVKTCIQCGRIACLGTGPACRKEPPHSPFPPEVVERLKNHLATELHGMMKVELPTNRWRELADSVASVVADYLRSEEARERVRDAVLSNSGGSLGTVATAVISALLGEH